jgi:hypothetical protein
MGSDRVSKSFENWTKSNRGLFEPGHSFAFGYRANTNITDFNDIDFSLVEEGYLSQSSSMVTDIYNSISGWYRSNEGVGRGDVGFDMSLLFSNDARVSQADRGLIAVAGGISPAFFDKDKDMDRFREIVDSVGSSVLEVGKKYGQDPIWAWSDYDFRCVENMSSVNVGNKGFGKLLEDM